MEVGILPNVFCWLLFVKSSWSHDNGWSLNLSFIVLHFLSRYKPPTLQLIWIILLYFSWNIVNDSVNIFPFFIWVLQWLMIKQIDPLHCQSCKNIGTLHMYVWCLTQCYSESFHEMYENFCNLNWFSIDLLADLSGFLDY